VKASRGRIEAGGAGEAGEAGERRTEVFSDHYPSK